MTDILDPSLWKYLESHCSPEPELLAQLNRETHLKVLKPRMLSGHVQGRLLSLLSSLIYPKRILEIGTFTGYASLCLAEGLAPDGLLFTIEPRPEPLILARKYFALSNLGNKIQILEGEALKILDTLEERFDLVFIDADKKNNRAYFDQVWDKVRPGGLILVDNVLWSGKILDEKTDPKTQEILQFNTYIRSRNDLNGQILPIRDGIWLIRKY